MPENDHNTIASPPRWLLRVSKSIYTWYKPRRDLIFNIVVVTGIIGVVVGLISGILLLPINASLGDTKLAQLLHFLLGTPLFLVSESSLFIIFTLCGVIIRLGSFGQDYLDVLAKPQPLLPPPTTQLLPPLNGMQDDIGVQYLLSLKDQLLPDLLFKKLPASLVPTLLLNQRKPDLSDLFIMPDFFQFPPDIGTTIQELASESGTRELEGLPQMRAYEAFVQNAPRISLDYIWQQMTKDHPVAVIQGFSHVGKSTLLARLVLHMTLRGLGQRDEKMPVTLNPVLTPLYLSLSDYAEKLDGSPTLSLRDYLSQTLSEAYKPEIVPWFESRLQNGACLLLFDNYDEIRDEGKQRNVRDRLLPFINALRSQAQNAEAYSRFVIVTRTLPVSSTEQRINNAPYYCISEWTLEQSEQFVLQCHGLYRNEAVVKIRRLNEALRGQYYLPEEAQDVLALARNPLLLTMLVALLKQGKLPSQRLEMYELLMHLLLEREMQENRNEGQIVKRLGPLALALQEMERGLTYPSLARNYVVERVRQSFAAEVSGAEARKLAGDFVTTCNMGCLFSARLGGYLGFCHPAFQTYVAARFLFENKVASLLQAQPENLVREVLGKQDAHYRDTLQLAFALACRGNDGHVRAALEQLLPPRDDGYTAAGWQRLFFVAACLIEAQPSYQPDLGERVANEILYAYSIAQQERNTEMCERVEDMLLRWLHNVPEQGAYEDIPVLFLLRRSIMGEFTPFYQQMTLLLLVMIARQMLSFSPLIFDCLIPPLLTLADLPPVGKYAPLPKAALQGPVNLMIVDLAVTVLSFMGIRGPAGHLYLHMVRDEFPSFLLKQSLASSVAGDKRRIGILFLPVAIPQRETHYKAYDELIKDWIDLCTNSGIALPGTSDEERGRTIYRGLLEKAEEVRYPSSVREIMQDGEALQQTTWERTWQVFLLKRLEHGPLALYQEAIWLHEMILRTEDLRTLLISSILTHYREEAHPRRIAAQHFIALLGAYAWSASYCRYIRDMLDVADLRDITEVSENNTDYIQQIRALRHPRAMRRIRRIRLQVTSMQQPNGVDRHFVGLEARDQNWLNDHLTPLRLRQLLLTSEVVRIACGRLLVFAQIAQAKSPFEVTECLDLLAIVRGRLLYGIPSARLDEDRNQRELQDIVDVFLQIVCAFDDLEIRDLLLEIIRCIPITGGKNILQIVRIADFDCPEGEWHTKIVNACADTLLNDNAYVLQREVQEIGEIRNYRQKSSVASKMVVALDRIIARYEQQKAH